MSPRGRLAAGVVGCLTLFAIGWTGLLIPSLIRSIEAAFGQDDAGIGIVYLVYAVAYACGSFGGGPLTEHLGRRRVLGGAVLVHGLGIAGLGIVPSWPLFAATAAIAGLGAGSLDGGANGLVLDAYRDGRGRAMNLLHASFSVGALSAPLVVGSLVELGAAWQAIVIASGVLVMPLAAGYILVPMPSGRRARAAGEGPTAGAVGPAGGFGGRRLLTGPLLLLGIAIAVYVASELGISSWLVRYLDPAPLATATLALSLYWAGIAVGRLVSSAIADRFDHLRYTIACTLALAVMVAAAVLAPSLPLSIAAFALAGVASGPVFPMIVAIGGEHRPERSAAVGGFLGGMAVVGSTVYPPAMGFLSVTVGLGAAMLGTAALALGSMLALVAFGQITARPTRIR